MDSHGRRHSQVLEPLKPGDYIKYPDVIAGAADITRPRDIYTFLSLGYVTVDPKGPTRKLQNQDEFEHLRIAEGKLPSSFYSDLQQSNQPSYVFFDTLNSHPKLPQINKDTQDNNDDECDEDCDDKENIEADQTAHSQLPRKSIINEDDFGINITQTYIFAPPDRLDETVKYNKNVILPKIKPKKTLNIDNSKDQDNPDTEKTKHVHFNPKSTDISPRSKNMNASNNYLFGTRPECMFMNHRLGDRNPFLRNNKDSPTLAVPKASPGLQDLKDYDEYPDVYWKLRDGTISQPEDLESDMIDRDLYRLRQISTLKLSTVEKTFQVNQDPFRRWRWKVGEPVFSPKQQQRPLNCRSLRDKKIKDIPIYPLALSKPQFKVGVSPIKAPLSYRSDARHAQNDPLSSSQLLDKPPQYKSEFDNIPALSAFDTPRDSLPEGNTPRDVVVASLESFRRMDEDLADDERLGKIPIHKLHELRGKKHQRPIKTSLVKVDVEALDTCRRDKVNSVTKTGGKNISKGVGHSHRLESFRDIEEENGKLDTNRSRIGNGGISVEGVTEDPFKEENNKERELSSKKRLPAPVSTLVLQPDLTRVSLCPPADLINSWDVETGTLSSAANIRPGMPSPIVSDSSGNVKEKRRNNNITPVKTKQLEVFSERAGGNEVIKIPTGRTSYHRHMPTYKLDLVNYPPANARQSCGRSNSAGISDARSMTNHTLSTGIASRKQHRVRSSENGGDQDKGAPPKSNGADKGVSIRFGQQGHVIVSTSREGRRSR